MTNIGSINWGTVWSIVSNWAIPSWQVIFSFWDFTIITDCSNASSSNYLVRSLNARNDPSTKNIIENSNVFEGIDFISEKYGPKSIKLECYMQQVNWKSYNDMIIEIKDAFAEIKGICQYFYRWELMELECVKEWPIEFDLKSAFKTFTVNLVWVPFFSSKSLYTANWSISESSWLITMNNNSNRIHPEIEIEVTWWTAAWLAIWETSWQIRYVRCWQKWSEVSTSNIWVEIKAIEKNTWINKAAWIIPTHNISSPSWLAERVTDEIITNTVWFWKSSANALQYVQIDLWWTYDIEKLQVWHYYADNRIFKEVKFQVSVDWINWIDVFDSEVEGRYKERDTWKTVYLEENISTSRWKLVVDEEVTDGDVIYMNFLTWDVKKNWWDVNIFGTMPKLWKQSQVTVTWLNKYSYPVLNQIEDPMVWSTWSWQWAVDFDNEWYRVWHLFTSVSIDNLKQIVLNCRNEFAYSVRPTATLYTDTSKSTIIAQYEQNVYWWANLENDQLIYNIEWYWLDISSYSQIYMEVYINTISTIPNSSTWFWRWDRSASGGNWTSYDYDLQPLAYVFDWQLKWLDSDYESTAENINWFDFNIKYKNKYL